MKRSRADDEQGLAGMNRAKALEINGVSVINAAQITPTHEMIPEITTGDFSHGCFCVSLESAPLG